MERPPVVLVARAIIYHLGKFLLVQRAKTENWQPGVWELPGGKIDKGQRFGIALSREIEEETGLRITVSRPIDYFDSVFPPDHRKYPNYLYFSLFCHCLLVGHATPIRVSSEHQAAGWFTFDRLLDMELSVGTLEAIKNFLNMR